MYPTINSLFSRWLYMNYACNMEEHGMLCQIKGYTREFGVIPVVLRSNLSKGQSHTASALGKVRGSPAHTLWSHKYTEAQFCIIFSTQSHPRTQTGVTCAHSDFPESPAHTDWSHKCTGTILHHFFHPQ